MRLRPPPPLALALPLFLACGTPLLAQQLDVAIRIPPDDGQAAACASSRVEGLDPNGDGFLAVRTGPGTGYVRIGELREGDVVYVCDARDPWMGVLFEYPRAGLPMPAGGWVHERWLKALAG